MGYKILKNIDFSNKFILELGPGNLPHRKFWLNKPKKFYAIDTNEEFLSLTKKLLPWLKLIRLKLCHNF